MTTVMSVGGTLARGHRDGITTSCPGDPLYAWVRAGMPSNGAVTPKPEILAVPHQHILWDTTSISVRGTPKQRQLC